MNMVEKTEIQINGDKNGKIDRKSLFWRHGHAPAGTGLRGVL